MTKFDFRKTKLIILDIDNTITNSNGEITKETIETIRKVIDKHIYVVLCTGRAANYTMEKSIICNSSPIIISDNGAIIYNYKSKICMFSSPFPNDTLNKIAIICNNNKIDCVFNTINGRYRFYNNKDNNYIKDIKLINNPNEIKEEVTQIVINSQTKSNLIKSIEEILALGNIELTNTNINAQKENGYYFCDFNIEGVSKGRAIKELMSKLKIKEEETICFGDSMNDHSMIEASKYFVALKNADKELKTIAFMITEYDNNESGVAKFIQKYII